MYSINKTRLILLIMGLILTVAAFSVSFVFKTAVDSPFIATSEPSLSIHTEIPININTATKEDLALLFGISEKRAQDIINYRESNGGFKTTDEIMNVNGIGEKTYANIKSYITV